MLRLLALATVVFFVSVPATLATVDQSRDFVHHEIKTSHDTNICGDLGTFTFDVTSHIHVLDNGNTFVEDIHESFTYTLVFDDPALGTWSGHGSETIHFVANRSGDVSQVMSNSKEGPVRIIEHAQYHTDSEGNVTIDRTFDQAVGC